MEFSQSAQHADYREIDYTDNEFCLAGLVIVMLEVRASGGLSHVIWGDVCSIVFEDQEIVLASEKDFKLNMQSVSQPTSAKARPTQPPPSLPYCSATKGIIYFMWASRIFVFISFVDAHSFSLLHMKNDFVISV